MPISLVIWALIISGILFIASVVDGNGWQQARQLRDCLHRFDNLGWYPGYTPLTAHDLNQLASRLDAPQTPIRWLGYEGERGSGEYAQEYWDVPTDLECTLIIPLADFYWGGDYRFIKSCESEQAPGVLFIWTNSAPPTDNGVNVGYHETCAMKVG